MVSLTGGCANVKESPITEISVYSTPGKPMMLFETDRPAESITVKHTQNSFVLIVGVNVPREGIQSYYERETLLTDKEWKAVVRLVTKLNLENFTPQESPGQILDFGLEGFTILTDARSVQKEWSKPLDNPDAPVRLRQYLVELVAQKFSDVELFYLQ